MTGFMDMLSAIRHRLGLVVGTGLAIFALVMLVALRLPREYAASSSLLIDMAKPPKLSSLFRRAR